MRQVCAICDRDGVYAKVIAKQRPDWYLEPLTPSPFVTPIKPKTPMPKSSPGLPMPIVLASCIPEPPEDEVLDWNPNTDTLYDCDYVPYSDAMDHNIFELNGLDVHTENLFYDCNLFHKLLAVPRGIEPLFVG